MPAKRPHFDAFFSVWLTVDAMYGSGRGVRDGAFLEIQELMEPHVLNRRGVGPSVDCKAGHVVADKLSTYRIEKLFYRAQRLIGDDRALEAEMRHASAQLRAALLAIPGSYLFPWRPRSKEAASIGTWVVVQFCPTEQRVAFHSGREVNWTLLEADDPSGPFAPAH